MEWCVPIDTLAQKRGGDDPRTIGGKASGLVWLARHGFAVPEGWVISIAAFEAALHSLPPACEPRSLLRAAAGRTGPARAADARQELLHVPLPKGLDDELETIWRKVEAHAPWGLAVRSSATCEDGTLASMAGLAETHIGVRGAHDLALAVRSVWASLASGRALTYLAAHGVRDMGMAVIVQHVVRARAAGVMFTRTSGSSDRVVNAGFGLGSPVVDGKTSPDMLRIDSMGRVLSAAIAHKPRATVVGPAGICETEVAHPDRSALSESAIQDLAEIAARLEKLRNVAWDVEFACDDERIWLVQARSVTGSGYPEGGDANTVWSRANVGEAIPGVATPLTWSIAGAFSEAGFRRAFASLGCSLPKNARLVGNVYGRFYLNLTQFMRIAAQVPWLDPRPLIELGGGAGGDELALQVADVSRAGFYARLPITLVRLIREQAHLDDEVASFERLAEKAQRAHSALDLAILPDDGLVRKIRDVQALLEKTGTVMLGCASSTLASHLALKMVLARGAPIGAERLAQGLTSGIRDLESARPAIGILRVVDLARREPEARAMLEHENITGLDVLPDGPTRRALQNFLDLYGDRAVREAELSTPRWREDPRPVLTMIRVALRGEARDVEAELARSRAHADGEMTKLLPRLGIMEQTLVRHLVARAQKSARLRERMRTWVTRVLGMLRETILDADRRLARLCPELDADARRGRRAPGLAIHPVFFLTVDEVAHALLTSRADLAPLVRARRAEFARDLARIDPPATFTGMPHVLALPPIAQDVLRGLPASGGAVVARARVLLKPGDMGQFEPGEVLVVHTTDVGWTPLFLLAAGVVTELGGPLSHAAIVAREFAVPSVVNVEGATRVIRTGDMLRVDGDRGIVERIANS